MDYLQKFQEKQAQIQADLQAWAAENLAPNQQIRCTIEVVNMLQVSMAVNQDKTPEEILAMRLDEFFTPERLKAMGVPEGGIKKIRSIQGREGWGDKERKKVILNTIADLIKCSREGFYVEWVGERSYSRMAMALSQVGIKW